MDLQDSTQPKKISGSEYLLEINSIISRNRGRELPGTFHYDEQLLAQSYFANKKGTDIFNTRFDNSRSGLVSRSE